MSYSGAPYNFIPLSQKVMENKVKPAHNRIRASFAEEKDGEELLSGKITFQIKAETPIFVGGGLDGSEFYKTISGEYAIPGSSLKGLARNNMQILGMGSIADDIEDYNIMYRTVANARSKRTEYYRDTIMNSDCVDRRRAKISAPTNVQAGYICCKGDKYYIKETVQGPIDESKYGKINYYTASERNILEHPENFMFSDYNIFQHKQKPFPSDAVYRDKSFRKIFSGKANRYDGRNEWQDVYYKKDKIKNDKYDFVIAEMKPDMPQPKDYLRGYLCKIIKNENSFYFFKDQDGCCYKGQIQWKGIMNNQYIPYHMEIYFKNRDRHVVEIIEKKHEEAKRAERDMEEKGSRSEYKQGWLVSTGPMNNKKIVYIIPSMKNQADEKILIDDKDILAFKRDYEGKKNQLHGTRLHDEDLKEKAKAFFALPKESEEIPVFFIRKNKRTYFGYTPYLRIFYDRSIAEGIPDAHKPDAPKGRLIDYARSILGYSDEDESYKSRVSFEDAIICNGGKPESHNVILGNPKLSSYLDYLKQEENAFEKTYNDDDFELRGIKQYWLHKEIAESAVQNNDKVPSSLHALPSNVSFHAIVHFKNLRRAELGLLLWCFYQGENYRLNIGKAKSYGYGRISISEPVVSLYDFKKMYVYDKNKSNVLLSGKDIWKDGFRAADYINLYKTELKNRLGIESEQDIEKQPGIKEFLTMKNVCSLPDPDNIRYMEINKKEYQNRTQALPTVEDVLAGKDGIKLKQPEPKKGGNQNQGNRNQNRSSRNRERNQNSSQMNVQMRQDLQRVNQDKGKKISAKFIRVDDQKKILVLKAEGEEIQIKLDGFKILAYGGYKKGQEVNIIKTGNYYELT